MAGMKASYLLMSYLGTIVHFCTVAARLMARLLARWMPSSMALNIHAVSYIKFSTSLELLSVVMELTFCLCHLARPKSIFYH